MSSIINYKFKSYKEFSTVSFEGPGLALWELRYEIISQRKMNSKDFDLLFYDYDTEEQITDEYNQIQRNSYIIVHRIPLWLSKNNPHIRDKKNVSSAQSKFLREPPENYVCFRCGSRGHFIQHCPTNNDRNFDIVKIRKPSGIPKDFLEKVEGNLDSTSAVLVADEGFVKAKPQIHEWFKNEGSSSELSRLRCMYCNGILESPVESDCGHFYCSECISRGDTCKACGNTIKNLLSSKEKSQEVERYLRKI